MCADDVLKSLQLRLDNIPAEVNNKVANLQSDTKL